MTMKPFEIQSTSLSINGVLIDTSLNSKLVIPGVTRATSNVAIEVHDTGDQSYAWSGTPVVIDGYTYYTLVQNNSPINGWTAAEYAIDGLDGEGYIDGISVVTGGDGYTGEAVVYSQTMFAANEGTQINPSTNGQWVEIPFNVRCGAGDIESEFSSGTNYSDSNVTSLLTEFAIGEAVYGFGDNAVLAFPNNFNIGTPNGNAELVTINTLVLAGDNNVDVVTAEGDYRWRFDTNGEFAVPGHIKNTNTQNYINLDNYGNTSVVSYTNAVSIVADDNGSSHTWMFDTNGNLVLPSGGDITRDGSSVLGGSSLAPYATIVDNKVSVTTDINFPPSDVYGAFVTVEGHQNFNTYFQQATGDMNGFMYAVGGSQEDSNYGIIYAFNEDGTIFWKASLAVDANAQTPRLHNIHYQGGFLYVGFTYYDNTAGTDYHGVAKVDASNGSVSDSWVITTPVDSYPQIYDLTVDRDGNPILAGVLSNEMRTLASVPTVAGGSVNSVIFNNSDLQGYTSQSGWSQQWQVETSPGTYTNPDYINAAYVPVTNLTNPSVTGMIVIFRYDQNQGAYWGGAVIVDPGGYTTGDQLKVSGSLLFGVDGVNDATWTYNGGQLQGLSGTPSATLLATTWFSWNQPGPGTDFTSVSSVNLKTYLGSQAYIWTPNWSYNFGGSNSEQFYGVTYDWTTSSIYACGEFWSGSSPYHEGALFKLSSTDGSVAWSKYIEDDTGYSNHMGSVMTDGQGNVITVGVNDNGYTLVTKLDTNGDIIWQSRQTNNNNWNNEPRGSIDDDGNIYVTGSWSTNNYAVSVMKLNGNDGSLVYARFINNQQNYDFYEFYDEHSGTMFALGSNLYYGGYTYDTANNYNIAFAARLPIDGSNTGTHGRWVFTADTQASWESCTSSFNVFTADYPAMAIEGQSVITGIVGLNLDSVGSVITTATAIGGAGSSITNVGAVIFADGSTQTTASGGAITWTNPNSNIWRIEEYNGGASASYNGGDGELWWDAQNSPSGSNHFRGAIIQYHAKTNQGTIIGTIHLASDYSQEDATHTEHISGDSSLNFISLWSCRGNYGQLYFKNTNGNNDNLLIQWTAKVFYGNEANC